LTAERSYLCEVNNYIQGVCVVFERLRKKFKDGGSKRLDKDRMTCNKPVSSPRKNKTKVVKACKDGEEKIVHFGDPNMRIKKNIKERKKSYCARSAGIKGKNDKFSANYWSRKAWDC